MLRNRLSELQLPVPKQRSRLWQFRRLGLEGPQWVGLSTNSTERLLVAFDAVNCKSSTAITLEKPNIHVCLPVGSAPPECPIRFYDSLHLHLCGTEAQNRSHLTTCSQQHPRGVTPTLNFTSIDCINLKLIGECREPDKSARQL